MLSSMLRVLALVLVVAPQVASAWDVSFIASGSLPSDFSPSLVTPPDAGGFWASGTVKGTWVLLRYSNNGTVNFSRYFSGSALFEGDVERVFALAAYPDGGVVDVDEVSYLGTTHCRMRRFDANGGLRWSIAAGDDGVISRCANRLQVDGAGNTWLFSGIRAIAPDGTPIGNLQGLTVYGQLLVDPNSESVYVYGCTGACYLSASIPSDFAAIEKITAKGHVWTVQAAATTVASALDSLVIGSDGNLYGYGRRVGGTSNTLLYGMSTTPDGRLRWELASSTETANNKVIAAAGSNGDSFVLYGDFANFLASTSNPAPIVAKIASSGSVQWRHSTGFQPPSANVMNPNFGSSTLLPAGNGDIVAALLYCGASGNSTTCPLQQARLDSNGNTLYAGKILSTDGTSTANLTVLPDSSSLATKGSFQRLDRNGNALAPPQTAGAVRDASLDVAETIGHDGSAFLLTTNGSTNSYAVTAYSKDGTLQWRTVLAASTANGTVRDATLVARSLDVCLIGIIDAAEVIQCYARGSGTPSAAIHLAAGSANNQRWLATALPNDLLLVLYGAADGSMHHALFDAQNQVLHDIAVLNAGETWGATSINASGHALIQTSTTSLVKFNADGTRAYSVVPDISAYTVKLADDDSALLSQTTPNSLIERLDVDGKLLWKSNLPLFAQSTRIGTRSIRFAPDAVHFYLYDNPPNSGAGTRQGYVIKLAQNDGHIVWSTAASFPFHAVEGSVTPPILLLDPTTKNLLLLTSYAKKIQLRQLSGSDGTETATRAENMGVDGFAIYDLALTSDGALTLISDTTDTVTGSAWKITTLFHPFTVAQSIRVGQPGIAGTWYAPYSTGQGFVLDYIAAANTVFMPWFTFAQAQATSPSSNVWYTLQGQLAAAATTADLKMYVSDSPGAFNSGKTGAKQVGAAQLSFTDCSRGTLRYQFDATVNSGAGGVISLHRLTPQTEDCLLADGSVQTASTIAPPAQGFDVRQSGSWYDPNTTGQGIELSVTPASSSSNGLLFGAWFTYDPAGTGNDPLNQYWFTLQSDLATANSGRITMPILQILGGTLDGLPTRNSSQVGTATLTFSGCDRARLDYQFANSTVAHAYAGLNGSLQLTKLGGCSPP